MNPDLPADLHLNIHQQIDIDATPDAAFAAVIDQLGERFAPGGEAMPMCLEPEPGGRWYRDLGNDSGHLWGHVQVIKPPTLIEFAGPMFMSYPALNHVQFRVTPTDTGVQLSFRHQALGLIDEQHRTGLTDGWSHVLKGVKQHAEHQ